MRILQVPHFYPPHVGGIEYHVEALSRKLVESGHRVEVYTSNVPRLRKHEIVDGVEVHRFTTLCKPLNNPLAPGVFFKLVGNDRFDVVHVHGHLHALANLAVLSTIFRKRPIVLTSHGTVLDLKGWKRPMELLYHRSIGRRMLRSVNRVIALSSPQAKLLEEHGAKGSKIVVIPHWVDTDAIDMAADAGRFRTRHGLGDRQIVLFVGRLLPIKGLEYLIEAVHSLQPRPALVLVGGEAPGYAGTRRALVHQVERLGLEKDVFFLGHFPKEELASAYLASDLFVLPSLAEGMPLVLLEAMAYGRCVLASDIPGNSGLMQNGRNGILFEPGNPVDLAHKMSYALQDRQVRDRLGAGAREDVLLNYCCDGILSKILEVYREVQEG